MTFFSRADIISPAGKTINKLVKHATPDQKERVIGGDNVWNLVGACMCACMCACELLCVFVFLCVREREREKAVVAVVVAAAAANIFHTLSHCHFSHHLFCTFISSSGFCLLK